MDSNDVYVKTAAGQDEVATRAHHLPAKQRSLLIMVDGRHSVGELLAHHPAQAEAQASLAALAEAGLIALVAKPAPAIAAEPAPAVAPAVAPAPAADIPALKRFICSTLLEALGPDADLFTPRIEKAADLPALLAQAEKVREVLRGAKGAKTADTYWEQLNAMLT